MRRRPAQDIGIDDEELGRECEAFLHGHYLAWLLAEGLPVAPWAHLNRVAHGLLEELHGGTTAPHAAEHLSSFEDAAAAVEAMVVARLSIEGLAELQRRVLVPLELDLTREPTSPRAVVEHVALVLRDDDGRSTR